MHRVGVLPFDIRDNVFALLFVTSQTRGRWILPKGRIKKNETHAQACEREAFEEAGVEGKVLTDFAMTVSIEKQGPNGIERVPVTYYPLLVTNQKNEWPEKAKRERHWALLKDAARVVHRQDYLSLINNFSDLSPWIKEAAATSKGSRPKALTPAQ